MAPRSLPNAPHPKQPSHWVLALGQEEKTGVHAIKRSMCKAYYFNGRGRPGVLYLYLKYISATPTGLQVRTRNFITIIEPTATSTFTFTCLCYGSSLCQLGLVTTRTWTDLIYPPTISASPRSPNLPPPGWLRKPWNVIPGACALPRAAGSVGCPVSLEFFTFLAGMKWYPPNHLQSKW